jgi:UDP-N-acetylmuramoyl-tripeptide--D-alanyl-D-alanine ligase
MNIWKKSNLEKALGLHLKTDQEYFGKIEFNSKQIKENDIFIALKEGQGDGHNYIQDAFERGAALAIVENYIDINQNKQVLVKNSLDSLYLLAEYKRKNTSATIIAITGSIGKTSFKEILFQILGNFGRTFCSYKNFNNYIGVPLNLASMPEDIDYAIFEIGMNHGNEIRPLVKILKPEIAIITSISPVHIENFHSMKELTDAKLEIFDSFNQNNIAILPRDSEYFSYTKTALEKKSISNIYSFGSNSESVVQYLNYRQSFYESSFDIKILGKQFHLKTSMSGMHQASNISGALCCISSISLDIQKSLDSLVNIIPLEGRGNLIHTNFQGKNFTIINDAYNASPESVKASLLNYKYSDAKNKALILGDMRELGDDSIKYHENLASFVLESEIKIFIAIGSLMKYLFNKLEGTEINCFYFEDVDSCIGNVKDILSNSESVLIKASNGIKLYKIVEYLKNS